MRAKSTIFTHRERLVLTLHNRHIPNAKIARELGIHRGTVQRILEKAQSKLSEIRRLSKHVDEGKLMDEVTLSPAA